MLPVFGWLGGLAAGAASAVGTVAVGAASAVGTAGGAVIGAGGAAVSGAGQVIGGAVSGVGSAIKGLPMTMEKYKPIIDVMGAGYGVYQSYAEKKQAEKAAAKYAPMTTTPIFLAPTTPGTEGGFQTIVDVGLPPEMQEMKEAYALQEHDTERLVKYGLIAVVAYIVLTRL